MAWGSAFLGNEPASYGAGNTHLAQDPSSPPPLDTFGVVGVFSHVLFPDYLEPTIDYSGWFSPGPSGLGLGDFDHTVFILLDGVGSGITDVTVNVGSVVLFGGDAIFWSIDGVDFSDPVVVFGIGIPPPGAGALFVLAGLVSRRRRT